MTVDTLNIAVVVHLFYQELANDMVVFLRNIQVPFDLYLSTRPEWEDNLRCLFLRELEPHNLVVQGVVNRGFDIQPFLTKFSSYYNHYDMICKVHGKKSPRRGDLAGWGPFLLKNLLGSPGIVTQNIELFDKEDDLGLVFPDYFPPMRGMVGWGSNWDTASRLGKKMGLRLERESAIDFPAGSMFWFRPKAMETLFDLNLQDQDFEPGAENCEDGTMAHAVERLFLPVVEQNGYRWKTVLYAP